jgi:hypothetical protein
MSTEPKPQPAKTHPLAAVPGLLSAALAALTSRWISTAEEVLALAASAQGREGLRKLLGFDDPQLDALLDVLAREVGSEAAARLSAGVPGGQLGLALTPEQKRRFGID